MKQSVCIPKTETVIEIERKKSRFIAVLTAIESRGQAESRLAALHLEHPNARHIVYAFRFGGLEREIEGASDDGEPKNTAGRPVLDVLSGHNVTNAMIAVVRYFGGTKLGTGGLVRAYADSARGVLSAGELEELIPTVEIGFRVDYPLHDVVVRLISGFGAEIIREEFGTAVSMVVEVSAGKADDCIQELVNASAGTLTIRRSDQQD